MSGIPDIKHLMEEAKLALTSGNITSVLKLISVMPCSYSI